MVRDTGKIIQLRSGDQPARPDGAPPLTVSDARWLLDWMAARAASEADRAAFSRASRSLAQPSPGRPARLLNRDKKDLLEADQLLAARKARTFHHALIIVASKYDGDDRKIKSIVERLRRRALRNKRST